MPITQYRKKRLAERPWTKIVIHANLRMSRYAEDARRFRDKLDAVLVHCDGEVMLWNGGSYVVLMVAEDEDVIWLQLKLALTMREMRGKGDWSSKKKYWRASTNRIVSNA
jgi:hypothetical protein